jgi:hypothetical protein
MKCSILKILTASLIPFLIIGFFPEEVQSAYAVSPNVVISQVYGGGGNTGATYKNDFIELYNHSAVTVDITGWSVQYASSTGSSWDKTSLSGTIQPNSYYLIQEGAGAGGTVDLPSPNATGNIAISAITGKVALVNNSTTLTSTCPTGLVDFLGYGSANCSETSPAAALTNTTAALRKSNGVQDTDNNSADFSIGAPNPHTSPPPDLAPSILNTAPANGASDVPLNSNITLTFSEAVNVNGAWYSLSCASSGSLTAAVTGGPTTFTIDPSTNFVVGESCTLTIYAANVNDQDLSDPPDNMTTNISVDFTTGLYPVSFFDVPASYWSWSYVERLNTAGITGGCGGSNYCPETAVSRGQMAVFLERGMNSSSYLPPAATGTVFGDVPVSYWSSSWVEKLFADGITGGCGGGNYCPDLAVSRAQMAVFLLRAKHGSSYTPPPATGVFPDVPTSYWAAPWIEQLYAESITGGCGGGNYCPDQSVTRGQMAVFLVRTFNLP